MLVIFCLLAVPAHGAAGLLTPDQAKGATTVESKQETCEQPIAAGETNCTVGVPQLIGKPISEASKENHPEFIFQKVGVRHASIPTGQIVDQNPRSNIHAVACDKAKMIVYYVVGAPGDCEPVGYMVRIGERLDNVIGQLPIRLENHKEILRNGQAINLQGNETKVVVGQWPGKDGQLCDKDKFLLFVASDERAAPCERAVVPEIPRATSFRDATAILNRAGFARVEYRVNERSVALSGHAGRVADVQLPVPNTSACRDTSVVLLAVDPPEGPCDKPGEGGNTDCGGDGGRTIEYVLIGLGLLGGATLLARRARPTKSTVESGAESPQAGDSEVRVRVDRP